MQITLRYSFLASIARDTDNSDSEVTSYTPLPGWEQEGEESGHALSSLPSTCLAPGTACPGRRAIHIAHPWVELDGFRISALTLACMAVSEMCGAVVYISLTY